MLASFYIHQENFAKAKEILREGLAGVPADALIYNYLAGIFFKQKDDQAAVENLQKAKAANSGYLSPALNLASYYLTKAEYVNAIGEYRSVLEQDVENLKALVGLGLAYGLAGQIDSAKSIYEQMLESRRPEAVLLVAQHYAKNKRHEDALSILDEALRTSPSYVPLYKLKAALLLERDQIDEAVNVLEQLEKLEVGSAYPKLISILLKRGQEAKAEKIAKNVIASNPEINYGYLLQATIFEYKRQLKRAADVVNRGLSALPEDSGLSLRLGRIHELNNNSPEAIRVYQDLINSKPNYYPGLFSLGALYDRLGNKKEAQSCYQKTIALNDRYVPALNNLAYLYADNYGDKDKALTLSLKAYRLAPEQQDIMDTLGYVLLKNDRANEAAKILEKANLTHSYNPTVSFHLALAYVELKQTGKAIAELEKSLKTGGFPEVEKCRRLLDKLKA
jgi:tetratricopeptide (TPR) repeat protein